MPSAADAIAGIESGGRYDLVGPTHPKYGRALGKYQVMESNLPQWSRQYLGREVSPQEFLASKEAQDAVFQGEFGRLAAKHGPEGAARAWFAGEGGMNDDTRKDSLGTSVADYARKFNAAYGGAAGLLDSPAAPSDPQAPGLLAGLTSEAQPQEGLLAGLQEQIAQLQQQQAQPALQDPAAPDPAQSMRRKPIDLSRLQAMLKQPARRASWG